MKKIGLVAAYNNNYGSLLQVYATQKALLDSGFSSEIVVFKKRSLVTQILRCFNFPLLKMKVKDKGKLIKTKYFYRDIYNNIMIRNKKFDSFRDHYLLFSEPLKSKDLVRKSFMNDYEFAILGSDQVWNPINYGTHWFTLELIPDEVYKMTYAPSFGVKKIPWYQREKTKKYLNRIDCISVREEAGKKIVKELTGRDVPVVCDPTLLVERNVWDIIRGEKKIVEEKYVFCYFLGNNSNQRFVVKEFAKRHNLQIVALQHLDEFIKSDVGFSDLSLYDVDPGDFINLISNAEYVFTDSFHGSIFSILYQKSFATFPRFNSKKKSGTNSRIENLFEKLNLKNHFFNDVTTVLDSDLSAYSCDYKEKLSQLRKLSNEYFKNAILNREKR